MSSKPKKRDYGPGEVEKRHSEIAAAEYSFYKDTYQKLLANQRDIAAGERFAPTLKGQRQANTMQELTGESNLALSQGVGQAGNIALGAIRQQSEANRLASMAGANQQLNVLTGAVENRMTAADALTTAARIGNEKTRSDARNKQLVRIHKNQALASVAKNAATFAATQGAGNIGSGSGSPFSRRVSGYENEKAGYYNTGFFGLRKKPGSFTPYKTG
jgi:hypothetical protein